MRGLPTLLLVLCGLGTAAAAPLRVSYSIVGPPVAAVWMAQESGAFKRNGLDIDLVYIPSSVTNIQALLGGSLDVAVPGISGVVLAAARGASVVAIAATMNRPPMTLFVQPEITRAEQIKGQVLGITRFNSTAHIVTALILRKLALANSVTLRPLGGNPEVQAAFDQKQIAGMVTSEAGYVPKVGEKLSFHGLDVEILRADEKRVGLLRLRPAERVDRDVNDPAAA